MKRKIQEEAKTNDDDDGIIKSGEDDGKKDEKVSSSGTESKEPLEKKNKTEEGNKTEEENKKEEENKTEQENKTEENKKEEKKEENKKEENKKEDNNTKKKDDYSDDNYGTDENHELVVKEEYVHQERPASLGPLPVIISDKDDDDGDSRNNKNRKKKRPRDKRLLNSEKLCLYLLRGEECPKGDDCIYSHDIESYMKTKPPDLPLSTTCSLALTTEGLSCPLYKRTGCCKFGVTCRVGSCHISEDGNNKIDKKVEAAAAAATTLNVIDMKTAISLNKRKYTFRCPRNAGTKKCNDNSETIRNLLSVIDYTTPKKKVDFKDKIYVAPLTTVGNLPFRRIMKDYGADITCGEMAVAQHLLEGKKNEWSLLKRHKSEDVFGIQLASGFPDQMTRVCEVITNENFQIDFVDMNLGCPLDLICKRYNAGASLMLPYNSNRKLKQMVTGMVNTLGDIPVTIKMRTGWDTHKPIAHNLISSLTNEWNINHSVCSAIMVHGRSRLQRYSKSANWDYIYNDVCTTKQKSENRIPIIGNGDIYSYQEYKAQVEDRINNDTDNDNNTLSKTAMLGRGALIKPWLPTDIKEHRTNYDISSTERFEILQKFSWYGLEHWGSDTQGVNSTRRFLLEWLSFLHRYIPIGLLPEGSSTPKLNQRPPTFIEGRNELETLMLSSHAHDWIKLSERLLGKVSEDFKFEPKHKGQAYNNKKPNTKHEQACW